MESDGVMALAGYDACGFFGNQLLRVKLEAFNQVSSTLMILRPLLSLGSISIAYRYRRTRQRSLLAYTAVLLTFW